MRTKTTVVFGIMLMAILMLITSTNAKTYDDYAGHSAVQYDQSDMGYPQSDYIESAEYDTDYDAEDAGVRLYLTSLGEESIESSDGSEALSWVTDYVIGCSEWQSDRSYVSIAREIEFHCQQDSVSPIHIQYFYEDLTPWEKVVYGK